MSQYKLLGVCIDNNIRFDEHISSISKKSAQRVGVLMRLKNLIPTQTKLELYKATVLPYLTYCHLIWHFCRASGSRRLERIQERALRAIYCDTFVLWSITIYGRAIYSTQPATTGHSYSHV